MSNKEESIFIRGGDAVHAYSEEHAAWLFIGNLNGRSLNEFLDTYYNELDAQEARKAGFSV